MRLARAFIVSVVISLIFPSYVRAQSVLKGVDLNISASLEVGTNSTPIVNEETTLGLTVSDENGQFRFENCDCKLLLITDGKTDTLDLQSSQTRISQQYTFTRVGETKTVLSGKPIGVAVFQPFSINFPKFNVIEASNFSNMNLNTLSRTVVILIILLVISIFFVAPYLFYLRQERGRKKPKQYKKK